MEKEVINIIANRLKLKANEIKVTDRLSEDLKADSIDMVELITDFEEKFNIVVNDEDAVKFKTVGDIITYCENLKK